MSALVEQPASRYVEGYKRLLGPIVEHYLRQLDLHMQYLDDGHTTFLFLTRAGHRILELYKLYLTKLGRKPSPRAHLCWSSRLLVCKGASGINLRRAINTIGREFATCSLAQTVEAIFASRIHSDPSLAVAIKSVPSQPLHEFMESAHPTALQLRSYLSEQSNLFVQYMDTFIRNANRVVLIDTGWTGTSQSLLSECFPGKQWVGLYFGWMSGSWQAQAHGEVRGLVFEGERYRPDAPETAICLHRHLIESLFEANAASIEELEQIGSSGTISAVGGQDIVNEQFDVASDPMYCGCIDHLQESCPSNVAAGYAAYQEAITRLASMLTVPSIGDADFLEGKVRSADFGRTTRVPVLIRKQHTIRGESPQARIARALWPQGQIALEYSPEIAERRQRVLVLSEGQPSRNTNKFTIARPAEGRVAVITRTKDRPILLERTARSVADQSFQDFVWVVVNDGGDPEVVLKIVENSAVPMHQIVFCDNHRSIGMEAASNVGIRASSSDFIVIHDDDDSWHPDFLLKTVSFLESSRGKKYGAVLAHSVYVSEEIADGKIVEWGRWPYHDWVQHVQLSELVVENFIPPIALLFRRSSAQAVDLFDEDLPVLGDWDFALRLLTKTDIGVLPEQLALYHHRDRGESGAYANSVVGGVAKHVEYDAIVRNKFIRGAAHRPEWRGVAALMAQGYVHKDLRQRIYAINSREQPSKAPVPPTPSKPSIEAADLRWCLLEAARTYYGGVRGMMRRFKRFPDEQQLIGVIKRTRLRPPPDFDDAAYLRRYQDVAREVAMGKFCSGFDHYFKHGRSEGRSRPAIG